jgi:hypothetical protein
MLKNFLLACTGLMLAASSSFAQVPMVPDLSGVWRHAAASAPGPAGVQQDPRFVQRGSRAADGTRQDPVPAIADLSDPLLTPWAHAELKKVVDKRIANEIILPARSLCWPNGVPGTITQGGNPTEIVQTRDTIVIHHMEGPEVRVIRLNVPHSKDVKPSWYGESVGHYEGDTLVVDTIGLNTRTVVDDFQTPHTEALHVVERYRALDNGNTLELTFTVEDPGTFTRPYTGARILRRQAPANPFLEIYCAENNFDVLTQKPYPLPTASKLDF